MLDTTTGEVVNLTLMHEGNSVREFYSKLPPPVLVGIEATGPILVDVQPLYCVVLRVKRALTESGYRGKAKDGNSE
jgi:hypothetical protein